MITNKNELKIISILMTILMVISFNSSLLPAFVAYAEGESTAETQAEKDAKSDDEDSIIFRAGFWSGPKKEDHLVPPWNYFHNAVQRDIRLKYTDIESNEMTFDDKTRADLFKVIDNANASDYGTAYFWEVKPGSYLNPTKMSDAKTQLDNYLKKQPLKNTYYITNNKRGGNEIGRFGLRDMANYLNEQNIIQVNTALLPDIKCDCFLDASGKYAVIYANMGNGIILYWFTKIKKDDDYKKNEAFYRAFKWLLEGFYLKKKKKYLNQKSSPNPDPSPQPNPEPDPNPVPTPDPTPSPSYADMDEENLENLLELIKAGVIVWGTADAVRYSIPRLKELYSEIKALRDAWLSAQDESPSAKEMYAILNSGCAVVGLAINSASNDDFIAMSPSSPFANVLSATLVITDPENPYAIDYYLYKDEDDEDTDDEIKDNTDDYDDAGNANPPRDPLIIHYSDTEEIEFSTLDDGVNFDLDNNGFAEKTAWIVNNDGFLVYDVNGNGNVDNGSELFGDQFVKPDGEISLTGFEALLSLDINKDGKLDKNDLINDEPVFNHLFVWFDTERNGKTDENELVSINDLGVSYFDLAYTPDNKNNILDTGTRREDSSYVYFTNEQPRKISEFWFPVNTIDTTHNGESTIGNVLSIEQALDADTSGRLLELCYAFNYETDIIKKHYYTKQILYFITDSTDIDPSSRGGNIDARDLHVIEQFMGHKFEGVDGESPNINAASILAGIYSNIENVYYNHLNLKFSLSAYRRFVYTDNTPNGRTLDFSIVKSIIDYKISSKSSDSYVLLYDFAAFLKRYDKRNETNYYSQFVNEYSDIPEEYLKLIQNVNNSGTIIGDNFDNSLFGNANINFIFGESGNDTIHGMDGDDYIFSSTGNDDLYGGNGNDYYYVSPFDGNDVIHDTEGDNKIIFDDSIDIDCYAIKISADGGFVLYSDYYNSSISLPDFIYNPEKYTFISNDKEVIVGGGSSKEVISGSDADDNLEAGDGFNIFYGGEGNDTIEGGKDMDFMYGGNGDDTLLGRNGVNILFGEGGNDTIYDGNDGSYLNGGADDDHLYGGGGADVLDGGAGNDYLQGDHGGDTYIYRKGYDTDTINASSDNNTIMIYGYKANQMINTRNTHNDLIIHFVTADSTDCLIVDHFFDYNSNRDINFVFDDGTTLGQYDITAKYEPIVGTDDDDWLAIQNSDNSIIHAGVGNDGLNGGGGNDELYGEAGNDTLYGNDGNDILDGGTGVDTLCGGNGEDTYVFAKGYEQDTINEWGSDHSTVILTDINSDEIDVSAQWGSNLLISVNGTDDVLTISNFKWGQASYTFKFADGAEGYVDKDTWQLILTKQPDVTEEDVDSTDENESESSELNDVSETTESDNTDAPAENIDTNENIDAESDINNGSENIENTLVA